MKRNKTFTTISSKTQKHQATILFCYKGGDNSELNDMEKGGRVTMLYHLLPEAASTLMKIRLTLYIQI